MATLAQLQAETWWRSEFTPPSLLKLRERLAAHFKVPLVNFGTRGNTAHLAGYHRSRAWVRNSRYCVSRTYSVTRTPGDRSGGDSNAVSALDITLPHAQLLAMCKRLDAAVRAGELEKITEWYGNTDGDSRVDGYDNLSNRLASSDPSHLWHAHLSFDRGHVGEDHTDLYAILTGLSTGDDDMEQTERLKENTGHPSRTVGHQLADLQNLRNWLYSPADGSADDGLVNPPGPNSRAHALLAAGSSVTLTPEDRDAIVAELVAALDVEAAVRAAFERGLAPDA